MPGRTLAVAAALLAMWIAAPPEAADDAAPEPAPTPAEPAAPPPDLDSLEQALPGISIHREERRLDLKATVIAEDGDWLELFACTPGTREHESVVTVDARPSHIHLALLLLEYEPGTPMRWERTDEGHVTHAPRGDRLSAFVVYEEDGEQKEVPVNEWVRHVPTGEAMAGNVWLFTGSAFHRHEEQEIYLADLNGTVMSLVNFGDDLIARPTEVTDQSDEQRWNTFADRVPEAGTAVTLRLRPYEGDADEAGEEVDSEQESLDGPPPPPADHATPPGD